MKGFILKILLRNTGFLVDIVFDLLAHLAKQTSNPLDDELVDALEEFVTGKSPRGAQTRADEIAALVAGPKKKR